MDDRWHRWRQRIGVSGPRCCAGLLGLLWVAGVPAGQEIAVSYRHGQLTVKVDQVPITTLAPVLEEALGCRVRLAGGLSRERITAHIEADDLYAGLARLFRAYNYSLVTAPGTDSRAGLQGVFVYPDATAGSRAGIKARHPLATHPDAATLDRLPTTMRRAMTASAAASPLPGLSNLADLARSLRKAHEGAGDKRYRQGMTGHE